MPLALGYESCYMQVQFIKVSTFQL